MTPDDYDQLFADSRDEPAFSNSDEGVPWLAANCDSCVHDKPARRGNEAEGCPLVLISLMGRTPKQWVDGPRNAEGFYARESQYVCTEYRHEDERPADPRPIATPPGQGELLPRAPYEGVRQLAPTHPIERLDVPVTRLEANVRALVECQRQQLAAGLQRVSTRPAGPTTDVTTGNHS